ncbi:hypothetical protein GCM10010302_16980 [Streptomyces polychromogenes]|uniref:Uncharacterized protein n=1 Tax=Streptomyces polychromogenes TaxID=67342 RepID=A0ABN0V8R6_9ACTN
MVIPAAARITGCGFPCVDAGRTALAAVLVVAVATPASAGRWTSAREPRVDGATASWRLECDLGDLKVHGWVEDARADAKCAGVRIDADAGETKEFEACGAGTRKSFSVTYDHINSALVALRLR